jgi:hypothetical protein
MAKTWRPRTYFGYEGRDKEDRFNWADVGTKAAQAIEDNAEDRETRKEEYRQFNNTFEELQSKGNELATSNNASLNNQIVATTQRAVDKYYEFYKKFTNGEISEGDWVQYRTNIMDGLNNYFGIMTDYSAMYEDKMKRKMEDKSQTLEVNQMAQLEGFNNYSQWQSEFGGDGRMYIGKVGKDGRTETGPGRMFRVSALRHNVDTKVDKFDVSTAVDDIEGNIGNYIKDIRRRVTTNKQLRDDYEKVRDIQINKYLNQSPFNVLSILTEDLTGFEIVRDPSLADDTHVYVETDPETGFETPQITEAHLNVAREYMATLVDGKVNIEETGQRAKQYRPGTAERERKKADNSLLYSAIQTYVASPTQENLKALSLISLSQGGGQLSVTKSSGSKGTFYEINVQNAKGQSQASQLLSDDNKINVARGLYASLGGDQQAWDDLGGNSGFSSSMNEDNLEQGSQSFTAYKEKKEDKSSSFDLVEFKRNDTEITELNTEIAKIKDGLEPYDNLNETERKAKIAEKESRRNTLEARNKKLKGGSSSSDSIYKTESIKNRQKK